jgi:hypothetical protein
MIALSKKNATGPEQVLRQAMSTRSVLPDDELESPRA